MKRNLFFLLILAFFFSCSEEYKFEQSQPFGTEEIHVQNDYELSPEEARSLLVSFIGDEVKTKSDHNVALELKQRHDYSVSSISTKASASEVENVPVYEFSVNENNKTGFALVAGDKRISTVIAYVPQGSLENIEQYPALKAYMDAIPEFLGSNLSLVKSIDYSSVTRSPGGGSGEIPSDTTATLVDGFNEYYTCPLPVIWGQDTPYNMYAPNSETGNPKFIGCTTIAAAQIMAYHRKPSKYNWDLILSSPTVTEADSYERKHEVATFLKEVADSLNVNFNEPGSESSAYYHDVVEGFTKMGFQFDHSYYLSTPWRLCIRQAETISASIKNGMPFYLSGSGHAIVVDGYGYKNYPITVYVGPQYPGSYGQHQFDVQTSHYYHANWGWGGLNNGWFIAFQDHLVKEGSFFKNGVQYDGFRYDGASPFIGKNYIINIKPKFVKKTLLMMHFDDNILDSTGENIISANHPVKFSQGVLNNCLWQDNKYLNLTFSNPEIRSAIESGTFTIDFWARFEVKWGYTIQSYIISNAGNLNNGCTLNIGGSQTVYSFGNNHDWAQTHFFPQRYQWYHFAVTAKDNLVRLFIDGTQVSEKQLHSGELVSDEFYICKFTQTSVPNIYLDEFRIINYCAWESDFMPSTYPY